MERTSQSSRISCTPCFPQTLDMKAGKGILRGVGRGLEVGLSPLLRAIGHDVLLTEVEGNEC